VKKLTDQHVAWLLWGAAFLALFATQRAVGFVRDESVYFAAAESYAHWLRQLLTSPSIALTDAAIVRGWDFNHEHPALMKTLFGVSFLIFHEGLGWLSPAAAFRMPAFAVAAIIPSLLWLFGLRLFGRTAALFAAISFFLVPRQYFNAQLACFDMPVAAFWLLTVYAYWRAQETRRGWLLCGAAFALALCTKHNALFLPFVLAPFALWRAWTSSSDHPRARAWALRLVGLYLAVAAGYGVLLLAIGPDDFLRRFLLLSPHAILFVAMAVGSVWILRELRVHREETFRALAPLAAMAVLGPVAFYAHWPYLWHHPVDRTAWYLAFHATHNHYAWLYLGQLLRGPPFPLAYVVVKTALTVPSSLFAPMVTGFVAVAGRGLLSLHPSTRARVTPLSLGEGLVLANAVAAIAIISHPQVPHFGGVKHWFPSMPFLALLAGAAVSRGAALIGARLPRLPGWAPAVALGALLCFPALIASARVHPYGTSYYSEAAGGIPGGASLGMQRQFWSNNVTGVLPWINEHAPQGARVYLHEVNGYSFRDYQRNGLLRADLVPTGGPNDAQIAAYQYHQEFREHELQIWNAFGTVQPVHGLYLDETPQVVVYQRR
jgi:hypothetical protein